MRVFVFAIFILSALTAPYWMTLCLGVLYAFRYTAYELIVLGVFLDALLSATTILPLYTIALAVIVFCVELVKPLLTFYDERA